MSAWFITLGCYYLLFGLMRGLLLARLRNAGDANGLDGPIDADDVDAAHDADDADDARSPRILSALTGAAVAIVLCAMGILTPHQARRQTKRP